MSLESVRVIMESALIGMGSPMQISASLHFQEKLNFVNFPRLSQVPGTKDILTRQIGLAFTNQQ